MRQTKEDPPCSERGGPLEMSFDGDVHSIAPKTAPAQDISRNPRAVFEVSQDDILAKEIELLGGLMAHAAIAQQFAEIGDARGFLYSLDKAVDHAVRAGDQGVALREIRENYRKAASTKEASQ